MKRNRKRILVLALAAILILGSPVAVFGAEAAADTAIKVLYDGEYITFTDAAPQIVNGRTMVPFRQILEAMGMTVGYDAPTRTVTAAKDDLTMSFAIGGSRIDILDGGVASVKTMDVVPFIDPANDRTYVSARFMAESLGYNVGWNSSARTVLINDFASLFAGAAEDFSILGTIFTPEYDLEKAYEVTGSFTADMEMAAGTTPVAIGMSGTMEGVQYKTDADISMDFAIDAPPELGLGAMSEMAMRMKLDGTNGILYMNAPVYSMLDPSIDANTWIRMDIFKMYDELGFDLRPLMDLSQGPMDMDTLIAGMLASAAPTDLDSYQTAKALYALLKNLVGDDTFTKRTVGSSTTYTRSIDQAAITAAIAKTALEEGIPFTGTELAELKTALDELGLSSTITVKTTGDALESYSMTGTGQAEGADFSFTLSGTLMTSDMEMGFTLPGLMTMTMTVTSAMEATNATVDLALPPGAKVIDYETLMPY